MKLQLYLNALSGFLSLCLIGCVVLWALAKYLGIQHAALRTALLFASIYGAATMFVLAAKRLPTAREAAILSFSTLLPLWFALCAIQRVTSVPFHDGIVALQSITVLTFGSLIYGYLIRRYSPRFEPPEAAASATLDTSRIASIAPPTMQHPQQPVDPKTEALLHAVREQSAEDPYIAAKIGALEIYDLVFRGLKDARGGVHVESLLCVLGALAGYACQARVRALCASQGKVETAEFVVVTGADGKIHYFGDALNERLAEHEHSLWRLAGGMAQHCGATELPEVHETFSYIASVVGTPRFGLPRVTEEHRPCSTPLEFVTTLWPALLPKVKLICPDPELWPLLFGLAVQKAMKDGKSVIDPAMAMKLTMEAAIAMSKIDLENACAAST